MRYIYYFYYWHLIVFGLLCTKSLSFKKFSDRDIKKYREKVTRMFYHAYDHYLLNAFPYDELQPISCRGMDTWGSFSLTLIDALDTLAVMKNYTEFRRVVNTLLATADFNVNINVSVFETNIRVVGGLLSAHLLSKKAGLDIDPGWPCSGPLLNLAEKVARKLLPAFITKTGMPFGTVNLRDGVPEGETPITCTAGVSTFIIEFGTLSHLTGDPIFEKVASKALDALWSRRSSIGLVGNHINVQDGKWTALDSGIGGGVDSYFEYLVKGAILFQEPKLLNMFKEYQTLISKYMKRDDWYFWVSMNSGQVTMPTFQSLEAFWPGLLTLVGDIDQAVKTLYNYHQVWKQYGFTPEIYDVAHSHSKRESYPLRPELVESVMYLYYATKDHHLLQIGVDILESIEHSSRTDCGYATINNVVDHKIEDRMESFFLAETTKYLYLLFDPDNFIHDNGSCGEIIQMSGGNCIIGTGGYVFNTEAHPIDIGAVYCCSAKHQEHQKSLYEFQKNIDLHSVLGIRNSKDFYKVFKDSKKYGFKGRNVTYITTSMEESLNESVENNESTIFSPNNKLNVEGNLHSEIIENYASDNIYDDEQNVNFSSNNFSDTSKKHFISSLLPNITNIDTEQNFSEYNETDLETIDSDTETLVSLNYTNETEFFSSHINSNSTSNSNEFKGTLQNNTFDVNDEENSTAISSLNNSMTVSNETVESSSIKDRSALNFEVMVCPVQPFTVRLSVMGQIFSL